MMATTPQHFEIRPTGIPARAKVLLGLSERLDAIQQRIDRKANDRTKTEEPGDVG